MTTKFAKRHYETLAKRMVGLRKEFVRDEDWKLVVIDLGQMFFMDNQRFKWDKFKEACGYNEQPVREEQSDAEQFHARAEIRAELRRDYLS